MLGFVHIPKTAGSTLKYVLRSSFGVRHCDIRVPRIGQAFDAEGLRQARRVYPFGLRSIAGHPLIAASEALPEVQLFTFVREPVARTLSAYRHHLRGNRRKRRGVRETPLEQFAIQEGNRQVRQLAGALDLERARRELERYLLVGVTEEFDASLDLLVRLSPYPIDPGYELRNAAPPGAVGGSIGSDPGLLKHFEEANVLDLELYAWVRERLWAAQRERAAGRPLRVVERSRLTRRVRARASRTWNNVFYRTLLIRPQRRHGSRRR